MSTATPPDSIDTLYREHNTWLHSWLRRRLGDSFTAADLAHDTFIRLLTGRQPANAVREPRALLAHIARCLVIDHWRRQEVERAYLETISHLPEPEAPSAEEHALIIEALMRIDAMLAALPQRTREIFLLAQIEGLTLQQVSVRTGVPVITVRRHIQKALLACMTAL